MNRRQFFKRVAATCAAAVVAPAVLVKAKRPDIVKVPWVMLSTSYSWDELELLRYKNQTRAVIFDEFDKDHPQYWSLTNGKWWSRETPN